MAANGTLVDPSAELQKIDTVASLGLAGTSNSLGYRVGEVENHIHSALQVYGLTANTMARKSTSPIIITSGIDPAWGTELELHNGTVIESGSATKKFDTNQLIVSTVGTANKVTIFEFYAYAAGTPIACTFQDTGDTVTKSSHGLANGTKVKLESIVSSTGITIYTIYYVVSTATDTFQLSLTLGGAAVPITTNGSGTYFALTGTSAQTLISEVIFSKLTTTADQLWVPMQMPRQFCNMRLSCRGMSPTAGHAVNFYLALHSYPA